MENEPANPNPANAEPEHGDPHHAASGIHGASAGNDAAHARRAFLFKLALLLNGAVGAVIAVPIVGYLLGPAVRKTSSKESSSDESWIALGKLTAFPEGETRLVNFRNPITTSWDGETGNVPCWVRHISGDDFQVFAINCAHLGCPVRWFPQSRLFMCPCHGGAYYEDGSRASGPPERGLFQYEHKIADGSLMIRAGKMPTLAAKNCAGPRLTQIQPAIASERDSWPA